ncbi:hypothetical protein [Sphingopyxis macrogoltabida]|uniref:Uncharacterized protein n=1 Tax=Sphingopyxis macrogoltabida TaxID=33050 RepID=A0AAC8Z170_SPHMC|nr:hypothetical protein [Sphingopyxis macrogoltabida]AMU89993.1 hypothetical protein ATM17_13195 [Sphingopyxis macrogoltabida]
MLKDRLEVATDIAKKLANAESAIDQALIAVGVLTSSLPQAQAAVKLSPVSGEVAFAHLETSLFGLLQCRQGMIHLHNELANNIKPGVGLRNIKITAGGDASKIVRPTGLNDDQVDDQVPLAA